MEDKLSTKAMMLDIMAMRSYAIGLLEQQHIYNPLLKALTGKDYFYDETIETPSLQYFAQATGIKYDKSRKYIRMIYNDLTSSDDREERSFEFKTIEFIFKLKGRRGYTYFVANSLPVIPRVGENIEIPFFAALTGSRSFYVDDIYHSLEDQTQRIFIELRDGYFNTYWKFKKDEAIEEARLNFNDLIELDEYSLKKKLRLRAYL